MFETILFPIDQSHQSIEAAEKALDLACSHNSRIVALSVVQPDRSEMKDHDVVAELLARTEAKIKGAGRPCQIVERHGIPAFVICDVADELNVSVIVIGTRGLNLKNDRESTAARVIQLAPCPVLVVP
ncbi:universal stress protein [Synechococcus sp. M16CYN]|uniref:universal stress protein n=1 Tax=Synechococcus sp. M16CYN TaxID=3103139 RepID=UPI003247559E